MKGGGVLGASEEVIGAFVAFFGAPAPLIALFFFFFFFFFFGGGGGETLHFGTENRCLYCPFWVRGPLDNTLTHRNLVTPWWHNS